MKSPCSSAFHSPAGWAIEVWVGALRVQFPWLLEIWSSYLCAPFFSFICTSIIFSLFSFFSGGLYYWSQLCRRKSVGGKEGRISLFSLLASHTLPWSLLCYICVSISKSRYEHCGRPCTCQTSEGHGSSFHPDERERQREKDMTRDRGEERDMFSYWLPFDSLQRQPPACWEWQALCSAHKTLCK